MSHRVIDLTKEELWKPKTSMVNIIAHDPARQRHSGKISDVAVRSATGRNNKIELEDMIKSMDIPVANKSTVEESCTPNIYRTSELIDKAKKIVEELVNKVITWDYDEIVSMDIPGLDEKLPVIFKNEYEYQRRYYPLIQEEIRAHIEDFKENNKPVILPAKRMKVELSGTFYSVMVKCDENLSFRERSVIASIVTNDIIGVSNGPNTKTMFARVDKVTGNLLWLMLDLDRWKMRLKESLQLIWMDLRMTTWNREAVAIQLLQYYPKQTKDILCSPFSNILDYPTQERVIKNTKKLLERFNKDQGEAIINVLNKKLGLIQGPPGTGKTRTIVGILEVLEENLRLRYNRPMKVLLAAPSNAAIDELLLRVVEALPKHKSTIFRVGRKEMVHKKLENYFLEIMDSKDTINTSISRNSSHQLRQQFLKEIDDLQTQLTRLDNAVSHNQEESLAKYEKHESIAKQLSDKKTQLAVLEQDYVQSRNTQDSLNSKVEKIRNASIIATTLSQCGSFKMLKVDFDTFDAIIIDEAAQAYEVSCLIPLVYKTNRIILVGDPNQLPATVLSAKSKLCSLERSMFERLSLASATVEKLNTQYRMHPAIRAFPSEYFYSGRLTDGPNITPEKFQLKVHSDPRFRPFLFYDMIESTEMISQQKSVYNKKESQFACDLVKCLCHQLKNENARFSIAILSPYKQQVENISTILQSMRLINVKCSTIDAFQGAESDFVVFSCVRANANKGIGFLQDVRRMNVGLTRAKYGLYIIGSSATLKNNEAWASVIKHAKQKNVLVRLTAQHLRCFESAEDDSKFPFFNTSEFKWKSELSSPSKKIDDIEPVSVGSRKNSQTSSRASAKDSYAGDNKSVTREFQNQHSRKIIPKEKAAVEPLNSNMKSVVEKELKKIQKGNDVNLEEIQQKLEDMYNPFSEDYPPAESKWSQSMEGAQKKPSQKFKPTPIRAQNNVRSSDLASNSSGDWSPSQSSSKRPRVRNEDIVNDSNKKRMEKPSIEQASTRPAGNSVDLVSEIHSRDSSPVFVRPLPCREIPNFICIV